MKAPPPFLIRKPVCSVWPLGSRTAFFRPEMIMTSFGPTFLYRRPHARITAKNTKKTTGTRITITDFVSQPVSGIANLPPSGQLRART